MGSSMQRYFLILLFLAMSLAGEALAFDLPGHARAVPAVSTASVRAAFAPGDDIAGQIVDAVSHARHQVLVQAFSFTHEEIARALIDARRRGVDVRVIADREQTEKMERGQVPGMARAGIPVTLDGDHQCAHNKVMVIDAGTPSAMVITGSFNFTRAAQHKNAENMVFISGSDALVQAYGQNWQRHLAHSQPLTIH
jgi:phosphatidylserine/phosphatidylglycerophosphate/cardiolipin synthase-like enzyme